MGNELDGLGERKIQIILSGGERKTNERRVCPNPDFVFRWRSGAGLRKSRGGWEIHIILSGCECEREMN